MVGLKKTLIAGAMIYASAVSQAYATSHKQIATPQTSQISEIEYVEGKSTPCEDTLLLMTVDDFPGETPDSLVKKSDLIFVGEKKAQQLICVLKGDKPLGIYQRVIYSVNKTILGIAGPEVRIYDMSYFHNDESKKHLFFAKVDTDGLLKPTAWAYNEQSYYEVLGSQPSKLYQMDLIEDREGFFYRSLQADRAVRDKAIQETKKMGVSEDQLSWMFGVTYLNGNSRHRKMPLPLLEGIIRASIDKETKPTNPKKR